MANCKYCGKWFDHDDVYYGHICVPNKIEKHTEKEILLLAGRLSIACESLIGCTTKQFGNRLLAMEEALNNYNNAVFSCISVDNVF